MSNQPTTWDQLIEKIKTLESERDAAESAFLKNVDLTDAQAKTIKKLEAENAKLRADITQQNITDVELLQCKLAASEKARLEAEDKHASIIQLIKTLK